MASTINTNISSLTAQRNLGMSQASLSTSIQRLSSGLRINSAKDDAAGLAISERFTTQIRGLRTSILYARLGQAVKVVAVTSALPGEGKTTTSVCLAISAAQAGSRVVVVDCDIRRRNVSRLLGVSADKGLLDVLEGSATL